MSRVSCVPVVVGLLSMWLHSSKHSCWLKVLLKRARTRHTGRGVSCCHTSMVAEHSSAATWTAAKVACCVAAKAMTRAGEKLKEDEAEEMIRETDVESKSQTLCQTVTETKSSTWPSCGMRARS